MMVIEPDSSAGEDRELSAASTTAAVPSEEMLTAARSITSPGCKPSGSRNRSVASFLPR